MYIPEVPFPLIDPLLLLLLQPFGPFPLIYSPNRPLRLVPAGFKISSCQSDNLVDLLWRVNEVPCGKERRRVWIDAFHFGIL